MRVISYSSRSLNRREAKYSAHKLEFLALKWRATDIGFINTYMVTALMYSQKIIYLHMF